MKVVFKTPLNIPRHVLVVVYFLFIVSSGFAIMAMDPMQEMLKLNASYSHLPLADMDVAAKRTIGTGVSALLLGAVGAGVASDFIGPRLTGLMGLAMFGIGYLMLFLGGAVIICTLGAILVGAAFSSISVAFVSIAALFPSNTALVLALLSGGSDLSLLLPNLELTLARRFGLTPVIVVYVLFIACVAGLVAILVPGTKFTTPIPLVRRPTGGDIRAQLSDIEDGTMTISETDDEARSLLSFVEDANTMFCDLPLKRQLRTWHLWAFLVYFALSFIRRKHYGANIRAFSAAALGPVHGARVTMYFNLLSPLGFLWCLVWGRMVDTQGFVYTMLVTNALSIVAFACTLKNSVPMFYISATLFCLSIAFIMSSMRTFLALVYGYSRLPTLIGMVTSGLGVLSIIQDLYWPLLLEAVGSYRSLNSILTLMGVALISIPLLFQWRPPKCRKF